MILVPTYYPTEALTCRAVSTNQVFNLPGFPNSKFKSTYKIFGGRQLKNGEQKHFQLTASFNRGGLNVGHRLINDLE